LISRDYLPALAQPNVDVVTDGIREVTENAIITEDGTVHEVDTIIYGTGFHVTDPPYAKGVFDDAGRSAAEVFEKTGPRAHLGTTISGFPNLFLMLGPNSGSGHTSMIMVIESQLELVLQAFRHARDHKVGVIDPRPEAQAKWIEDVDKDAEGTVWTTGGCSSWYNDASGRNATLWPGSIAAQRKVLRFRTQEYRMVTERKSPVKAGAETESPPDTRAACPART